MSVRDRLLLPSGAALYLATGGDAPRFADWAECLTALHSGVVAAIACPGCGGETPATACTLDEVGGRFSCPEGHVLAIRDNPEPDANYEQARVALARDHDRVLPETIALLERAARAGHAAAQRQLYDLSHRARDYGLMELAEDLLRRAAKSGCGDACVDYGKQLLGGEGVAGRDIAAARRWLLRAVHGMNSARASWVLYRSHAGLAGDDIPVDMAAALPHLYRAAAQGHEEAADRAYLLGLDSLEGRGQAVDRQVGIALLCHAARGGHPYAQSDLVLELCGPDGSRAADALQFEQLAEGMSFEEVVRYARAAAEAGVGEALDWLSAALGRGVTVLPQPDGGAAYVDFLCNRKPSPPTGVLRRMAAASGMAGLRRRAGLLLRAVQGGDIEAGRELHAIWHEFLPGGSAPRDDVFAIDCLRAVAREDWALRDAQYDLGVAYSKGLGVIRNVPLAITWFERSGNADAQWGLYRILSSIDHGHHDPDRAFECLRKAARADHPRAVAEMARLGLSPD